MVVRKKNSGCPPNPHPYNQEATKRQIHEFLGAVGYCCLWILGFAEIAQPLYEATKGLGEEINWTEKEETAFQRLKEALTQAPALALPDIKKPFYLYMAEKKGIAKGMLTQTLDPGRGQWSVYLSG